MKMHFCPGCLQQGPSEEDSQIYSRNRRGSRKKKLYFYNGSSIKCYQEKKELFKNFFFPTVKFRQARGGGVKALIVLYFFFF